MVGSDRFAPAEQYSNGLIACAASIWPGGTSSCRTVQLALEDAAVSQSNVFYGAPMADLTPWTTVIQRNVHRALLTDQQPTSWRIATSASCSRRQG